MLTERLLGCCRCIQSVFHHRRAIATLVLFKELLKPECMFRHNIIGAPLSSTTMECALVIYNPLSINSLGKVRGM